MILVDSSIWIDHLHATEPVLVALLEADEVGTHPLVLEELALGHIRGRGVVLDLLGSLRCLPLLEHAELLHLVDSRQLWGRGIGPIDAHLLGATLLVDGAMLWTRDKRLRAAADHVGAALFAA